MARRGEHHLSGLTCSSLVATAAKSRMNAFCASHLGPHSSPELVQNSHSTL